MRQKTCEKSVTKPPPNDANILSRIRSRQAFISGGRKRKPKQYKTQAKEAHFAEQTHPNSKTGSISEASF